jgi:hypothetical protein
MMNFAVVPQAMAQVRPTFHLPLFQRSEQTHGDSFFST